MPDTLERLNAALAGRYHLDRQLGQGGMATVYGAQDLKHGRPVALKVLHPELALTLGPGRFLREIKIAAKLTHPNILPLFDSGETDGYLWYTMPLVEGESLRDRLKRERQLPLADAFGITREVADALSHGHSRGIVHRDIKPENILLAGGHAVVADFGIARAIGDPSSEQLTTAGMIIGTPGYMSPEQATGEGSVDARTDIYSLACVLYEMLAGEPPYTGPTLGAIAAKQLHDPVPSVRRSRETVPEAVARVLEKALAKVLADRFVTAAEFAAALDSAIARGTAPAVSGRGWWTWRRWAWQLTAAAAVGALVVAGAAVGRRRSAAGRASSPGAQRIAVLPFANLSPDSQDAYFADGVTEELSTTLSEVPGLSVIARTSARGYRDRSVADIARELNVGSVLEGSVRKLGNRARIAVKLIDARTQATRWSADYDETVTDILAVQSAVARQVVERLRVAFGAQASRLPPASPEAYETYLRGRYRLHGQRTRANADSATALLERAVALDPTFAPAQAALASAYVGRFFNYDSDPHWQEQAYLALDHALRLDSTLATAYKVRGDLAWTEANGWRVESALGDFRHALAIEPSLVDAHNALGSLYFHIGLLDDARRELNVARDLDPLDQFATPRIARTFWYGQQFDSAWAWFSKTRGFPDEKALVLRYLGRIKEAFALLDSALASGGDRQASDLMGAYAVLLAASGKRPEAEVRIRDAIRRREGVSHFHHVQYNVASAYALLGDRPRALQWLRRTADNGMPCYPLFAGDPNLNALRSDPEFVTFLREQKTRWERFQALVRQRVAKKAGGV